MRRMKKCNRLRDVGKRAYLEALLNLAATSAQLALLKMAFT